MGLPQDQLPALVEPDGFRDPGFPFFPGDGHLPGALYGDGIAVPVKVPVQKDIFRMVIADDQICPFGKDSIFGGVIAALFVVRKKL